MADNRQFGSAKNTGAPQGSSELCSQCEAMLADALDGILSPADQASFDGHMAHCGPCAQMLVDARRGAAWLEILREPRPEPPASLLERILTQTSGMQPGSSTVVGTALHAGIPLVPADAPAFAKVLPFPSRFAANARRSSLGQILLQPRLAMTAAMAFFSIALTLNLTGIRLRDLRASDLRPASIQRGFYSTNARVVQYYESLRVVYELESRVHDLQTTSETERPAADRAAKPTARPATRPAATPGDRSPRPRSASPVPNSGTSRRETSPSSTLRLASLSSSTLIHPLNQGGHA